MTAILSASEIPLIVAYKMRTLVHGTLGRAVYAPSLTPMSLMTGGRSGKPRHRQAVTCSSESVPVPIDVAIAWRYMERTVNVPYPSAMYTEGRYRM